MNDAFLAGPLRVRIETCEPSVREKIAETLALYDRPWDGPFLDIVLDARSVERGAVMVDGAYLRCARMTVDADGGEGGAGHCTQEERGGRFVRETAELQPKNAVQRQSGEEGTRRHGVARDRAQQPERDQLRDEDISPAGTGSGSHSAARSRQSSG